MFRLVYDYAVAPTVSRAANTITSAARPLVTTAYTAAATVLSWVQPLPSPGSTTKWRHGLFKPITENDIQCLLTLFKDPNQRRRLKDPFILCALHNPGIAIDLFVVHDQKGIYDEWVINHYADWSGGNRDRLFTSICKMLEEDGAFYEPLIRQGLEDRQGLLYQVLHDHRYTLSIPAVGGAKPSTLMQINDLLREMELNRILAGLPKSNTSNRNK